MTHSQLTAQPLLQPAAPPLGRTGLPAWPVTALLWGLPVWWVVGLFPLSPVVMAFPMMVLLLRERRLAWVPGVLPWFAFMLWMVPAGFMLGGLTSAVGFLIRFIQLLAVGVLLVYVVNAFPALSRERVMRALCASWVATVVGGYLGLLKPYGRLTVTLGTLLPGGLPRNSYVRDLMFPPFAEIQHPMGSTTETLLRPSAPYAYTNGWGAAMAMLTPVVVAWMVRRRTVGSTALGLAALAAAVPPAIATTNRGLFLTLAVCVLYVTVRLAFRGQLAALAVTTTAILLAVSALLALGLQTAVEQRQSQADTSQGRSLLYQETFRRTLSSPVVGYGAPRPSESSEISVGTQGMIWNVMFCFGFVGLALFVYFMVSVTLRTRAARDTTHLWLHSVLVGACLMGVYYGMDRQLVYVAVVAGLLLRERYLTYPPRGRPAGWSLAGGT